MGLDAIDIVLRCEETFDLRLEDKDIGQINTVGQLFEHLGTKLGLPSGTAAPERPGTSYLRDRLSINPAPDTGPAKTSGPPS